MASISSLDSPAALEKYLRDLDEAQLLAQAISWQGAVHAIGTLLASGCTKENATAMLSSLRACAELVRKERKRRGAKPLFEKDQTGFQ